MEKIISVLVFAIFAVISYLGTLVWNATQNGGNTSVAETIGEQIDKIARTKTPSPTQQTTSADAELSNNVAGENTTKKSETTADKNADASDKPRVADTASAKTQPPALPAQKQERAKQPAARENANIETALNKLFDTSTPPPKRTAVSPAENISDSDKTLDNALNKLLQ